MIGTGYENKALSEEEIGEIVARSLDGAGLDGKRVLVLIPDHTRTSPIPLMFRTVYNCLSERAAALDVMIALGTHQPMPDEHIYSHVGITAEEHERLYSKTRFFNHEWDKPDALAVVGGLTEDEVEQISGGLLRLSVEVAINKQVLDYDHLLVIGPVFPHEVAGFSGGSKYFFPGISGPEVLNFFHWLGALITNPEIIGHKWTPVRQVIERAAALIPVEKSLFCMVVSGNGLSGLYYGGPKDAWSAAADLSDKLHIVYREKPYHTVLSCAPKMYDDIWTAGKCMYKLEPVVADGGKLIIYARHITEISYTHGGVLDEIGYHTRDYFVKQWDKFKHYPWGVLAHSTHVRGIGTYENGVDKPRVEVILATRIPESRCRKINLGYIDIHDIRVEDYMDREDEGILYVQKAGETLYRLKNGKNKGV
ncbi:MAG: DUF2088 domain-containing protein [Armatimonadetes bacterium]|nr:DUF2088 domain-containing protein [Armatimonadota bacterium]